MTAADFRSLALSFPEAAEGAHGGHADFRVRGKIFASLTREEDCGMVKLPPDEQASFVRGSRGALYPASGAWGRYGCTMVRLEDADEAAVRQALILAWRHTAPKRLVRQYDEG